MSEQEAMRPSPRGLELIKKWEGLMDGDPRTVPLDPFLCPGNVVTIGWGHVVWHEGMMLKGQDGLRIARYKYPDGISRSEAESMLQMDAMDVAIGVNRLTHVKLNQNQFDALVSFAYNLGLDEDGDDIAEGLGDSTLLKYVNRGQFYLAGEEFGKWIWCGGVMLDGLARRREEERLLFLERMDPVHQLKDFGLDALDSESTPHS